MATAVFSRLTGRRVLYGGILGHLLLGSVHLWWSLVAHGSGLSLLFEVVVFIGSPVGMFLIVRGLERRFPREIHYWQLVFVGALGTALAILLSGLYLVDQMLEVHELTVNPAVVLLAADVGGPMGLVIGWQETATRRSIARARTAELRGRLLESQERRLTFLNRILRHHLLNGLSVISAASFNLRRELPDVENRHLDLIDERSDELVDYIEQIRTVVTSLSGDARTGPTDVRAILEATVAAVARDHPEAEFRTDLVGAPTVTSSSSLRVVLEAVLENAVQHTDAPRPLVEVCLEGTPGWARIVIADDGPGMPDDQKHRYFDRGELGVDSLGEGLGLYLADVVTGAAGGRIRIEDNVPRGTRVVIELPRVDPDGLPLDPPRARSTVLGTIDAAGGAGSLTGRVRTLGVATARFYGLGRRRVPSARGEPE